MGDTPITSVPANPAAVRTNIARAAQRTGVDFDYLLAQARIESSLNPNAKAQTSSAAGLFQFTDATWLSTLERHGSKHGLGWASSSVRDGKIVNPAMASQIMALRYDPGASSLMAGELAGDNRADLMRSIGRQPDDTELYLAHFLGSSDAARFINALEDNPLASASQLLPKAAAANPAIFNDENGSPRSLADVWNVLSAKVSTAKTGMAFDPSAFAATSPMASAASPYAGSNQGLPSAAPVSVPQERPSMADSLKSMFGNSPSGSTPPAVKAAYAKFERFGL